MLLRFETVATGVGVESGGIMSTSRKSEPRVSVKLDCRDFMLLLFSDLVKRRRMESDKHEIGRVDPKTKVAPPIFCVVD